MNIERPILAAAIAAALWGCAGPRKQQTAEKAPPSQAQTMTDSLKQMEKLSAELNAAPAARPAAFLAAFAPLEPALCARVAGSGAPVFDAAQLNCVVSWIRAAQSYLAAGGAPTKYTNQQEFDSQKKSALDMLAAQTKWLSEAKWEAKADSAAVAASGMSSKQASQQSYLDGMVAFQKGDYIKARASWSDALKLDPLNSDAQAGLDLLDKRYK